MIALRRRISEVRMQERNWSAPEDWTEWEKQFYPTYHRRICETMGLLQNYLMYTRPSVAIATLTLISLGVAASVSLVLIYAVVFSAEFIHNRNCFWYNAGKSLPSQGFQLSFKVTEPQLWWNRLAVCHAGYMLMGFLLIVIYDLFRIKNYMILRTHTD